MFMALVFLLLVSLVCGTILAAATSSLKAVHSDHDQRQAYLNVESAAKLVSSQLADSRFDYTCTQRFDAKGTELDDEGKPLDSGKTDGKVRDAKVATTGQLKDAPLEASVRKAVSSLLGWTANEGELTRIPSAGSSYKVRISASGDGVSTEPVSMSYHFELDKKGRVVLTANFCLESAADTSHQAMVYLRAVGTPGKKQVSTSSVVEDGVTQGSLTTTTQSLTWDASSIKLGKGVLD